MTIRRSHLVVAAYLTSILAGAPARAQPFDPSLYNAMRWRLVGPFRGGRTVGAAGVAQQPSVFYVGVNNGGVWKTTDYGLTWTPLFDDQGTQSIGAIAVAPSDPDTIYVGSGEGLQRPDLSVGDGIYKSADGGKTWEHLGLRDARQIGSILVDPEQPGRVFVAALGHPYGPNQERGVFRSIDGGQTFTAIKGAPGGDDYHTIWINPDNPNIILLAGDQGATISVNDGQTWSSWYNQPTAQMFHVTADNRFPYSDLTRTHPGVPANLGIYATEAARMEHRGVIYSIGPSPRDVNVIWVGSDDGLVHVTLNGGKTWKDVTPTELNPWSKVTQIDASHYDPLTAYVSVSRFRLDDLSPLIFKTHDGGKSWTKITSGLADNGPVNVVREDPVRQGLLFAGTERDVYASFDDGRNWQPITLNLPHSSMRDLVVHDNDLIVAGRNPPDGAIIDYYLREPAAGAITLEVLTAAGQLVRRYRSSDPPDAIDENEPNVPTYWMRRPMHLSAEKGMHRVVWDLHYPAPDAVRHEYPISAIYMDTPRLPLGRTALPGAYIVRLTVGGTTFTQPLTVRMDPRVKAPPLELARQFTLAARLTDMMHKDYEALQQLRAARRREGADGSLAALERDLTSLNADLAAVYDIIEGADAAPTAQAVKAVAALQQTLNSLRCAVGTSTRKPTAWPLLTWTTDHGIARSVDHSAHAQRPADGAFDILDLDILDTPDSLQGRGRAGLPANLA